MENRFEKMFTLKAPLYSKGAPVIISAGALLKDNQTGNVLAQVKYQNVGEKCVKAISVNISAQDIAGREIPEIVKHDYLDLSTRRDGYFGQKEAIKLPRDARSFSVTIDEIVFEDNQVWATSSSILWTLLPTQKGIVELLGDEELVEQYKIDVCEQAKYEYAESDGIWLCACGGINTSEESVCHLCGTSLAALQGVDCKQLNENKDARVAAIVLAKAEEDRIKSEKRKKRNRILAIVVSAIVIIVAAFYLITKVFIPGSKYKTAINLFNQERYEEAIPYFIELGDYKDSAERIELCNVGIIDLQYREAIALYNACEYEKSNVIFNSIIDYKDSANHIHVHDFVGTVITPAGCETEGVMEYHCTKGGCKYFYTDAIAATGHSYSQNVIKAVTCTTDGEAEYVCDTCGESHTEVIPATGHSFVEATCTSPKTCSTCGLTEGKALGHTTTNGTCSRCGKTIYDKTVPSQYIGTFTSYSAPPRIDAGKSYKIVTITKDYVRIEEHSFLNGPEEIRIDEGPITRVTNDAIVFYSSRRGGEYWLYFSRIKTY